MRFGITTHGLLPTPPSPQHSRHRPKLKQRAITAPPSPLPTTRLAFESSPKSFQSDNVVQEESSDYFRAEGFAAAASQEPGGREEGGRQESGPRRIRSVQFCTPAAGMAGSPGEERREAEGRGGSGERYAAAESSGDEITPMVSRERGAAKGYDATATSNSDFGYNARISSQGSEARRRIDKKTRESKVRGRGDVEEDDQEEEGGWWARAVEKFGSVELDNKGSVARDHLALERTFLAWLRTSLAFASIGIAITQLFRLNTTITEREGLSPNNPPGTFHLRQLGKPLGATFLGIAILVLAIGGRRYFESQYWIIRGKFPASRGSIFLIAFVAVALIITSLVVVITVDPSVFEKR